MKANQVKKIAAAVAVIAAANQGGFTWNIAVKNAVPCIGGWYDSESGLYYYDATEIFDDKGAAENAARENEQLAYFDLDNLAEIRI